MPGPFADFTLLFAQQAAKGDGGGGLLPQLMPLLVIMALFYIIMIRPQQQQERKRKEMINALKKNDRVLTQAGIYGTVVSVSPDSDRVVVRVDDDRNVRLEFSRASISRVIDAAEKEKEKGKAADLA